MKQNPDPVVLLSTYTSQPEAYAVKGMLEANGIVCTVSDELMSTIYGGIGAFPARLYVLRSQLALAQQLLAEHNDV